MSGPCGKYSSVTGVPMAAINFIARVHDDGHQCLLDHYAYCRNECKVPRSETCRLCVIDANRCPQINESTGALAGACCPFAPEAMACADCLGRHGNDVSKCQDTTDGLSIGTIVGIVVGSIAGLGVLMAVVYGVRSANKSVTGWEARSSGPMRIVRQ
jgi:hypothetical protein